MQKRAVFYVYVIFWEQSGQAGVENGAMLTTYLFRYTSECTMSLSNFQNFFRLRRQGGIDPLTKILRTFLIRASLRSVNLVVILSDGHARRVNGLLKLAGEVARSRPACRTYLAFSDLFNAFQALCPIQCLESEIL